MAAIHISQLSATIAQELNACQEDIAAEFDSVAESVVKDTVEQLRQTSPIGHTGKYAPSWAQKFVAKQPAASTSRVVYSRKPQYAKTHLLEKGHAAVDGSWVRPRTHIAPVESRSVDQLVKQLTKRLGG